MVKSMTGFGRASREIDGYMITVELKSVNHRYFEFSCRCPRQYGFIDDKIKSFVNSKVARGKIECYVGIEALNTESADVVVNNTLANAYVKALKEISTNYDLKEDFGASTIARFPDVLIVRNNLLTDTSIANVALEKEGVWYTPRTPLLKGTKRALLLEQGVLTECDIPSDEISSYSHIALFNAMIDFQSLVLEINRDTVIRI